jgi:hypothetical protein
MSEYGISVTLASGFTESVERTRAALAEQGFGVLTEIDVAATMKAKLGAEMAPYLILGACNPPLAHRALAADRRIGLLLSCNVVVRTAADRTGPSVLPYDPELPGRLRPFREEALKRGLPSEDVERWIAAARPSGTLVTSGDGPGVGRFGGPLMLPADTPDP